MIALLGGVAYGRILKCSARSIRQIRYRPAAPQAPRDRTQANADNRRASRPSLFERLPTVLLINIYCTPVSGVFRRKDSGFVVCGENLANISRVVAEKRQTAWGDHSIHR